MPSFTTVACAYCGKSKRTSTFDAQRYKHQFCSKECRSAYGNPTLIKRVEVHCANCSAMLYIIPAEASAYQLHFCNLDCKREHQTKSRPAYECPNCGKPVRVSPSKLKTSKRIFCSNACSAAYFKGKARQTGFTEPMSTVVCNQCGQSFPRKQSRIREYNFCSRKCSAAFHRGIQRESHTIAVACAWCGKEKRVFPSRIADGKRFYCNHECQVQALRKEEIHIEQACQTCGKIYQTTIHQLTKRGSQYCSRECMNKAKRTRPTAHAYYWRRTAALVRQRDNYACQLCGLISRRPRHHVHHIIPASQFSLDQIEAANDMSNLITLCPSCHRRVEANPSLLP